MYVCMHVCMHACTIVRMHEFMDVCLGVHMCIGVRVCRLYLHAYGALRALRDYSYIKK